MSSLAGKIALVAGATRGGGRGIAAELGAAGATVYVTGRTTRAQQSEYQRPETIQSELKDSCRMQQEENAQADKHRSAHRDSGRSNFLATLARSPERLRQAERIRDRFARLNRFRRAH